MTIYWETQIIWRGWPDSGLDTSHDVPMRLARCVWPGCYPLIYLDSHNEVLCSNCADSTLKRFWGNALMYPDETWEASEEKDLPIACDVFYEGPNEYCADCNCEIESAYGEPEED